MVHTYAQVPYEGQSLISRPFEIGSKPIDGSSEDEQTPREIDNIEESIIIDLDFSITNLDNISIMTLTTIDLNPSEDYLPLVHPELID